MGNLTKGTNIIVSIVYKYLKTRKFIVGPTLALKQGGLLWLYHTTNLAVFLKFEALPQIRDNGG